MWLRRRREGGRTTEHGSGPGGGQPAGYIPSPPTHTAAGTAGTAGAADCTPPGLADGPDLHPLQFQLMVWALPCSEDFSTAGGAECWSELTGGLSCSVQLSQSVVLDEKLRVWQ